MQNRAGRDLNAFQGTAALERVFVNALESLRNVDLLKPCAVFKGARADCGKCIGQSNLFKKRTVLKHARVHLGRSLAYGDFPDTAAAESALMQFLYRRRDRDGRNRRPFKGFCTDRNKRVRQRERPFQAAARKSLVSNGKKIFGEAHAR